METFTIEDYPGLTLVARVFENGEIDSNVNSCIINPNLTECPNVHNKLVIKSIYGKISGKPYKINEMKVDGTLRYIRNGINCTYVGTFNGLTVQDGIVYVEKIGQVHVCKTFAKKIVRGFLTIDIEGSSNVKITDIVDIKTVITNITNGTIKSGDNIAKIKFGNLYVKLVANGYLYDGECTIHDDDQFVPHGTGKLTNLENLEVIEGRCDFNDLKYLSLVAKNFYPKAMLAAFLDQK